MEKTDEERKMTKGSTLTHTVTDMVKILIRIQILKRDRICSSGHAPSLT
jgi:hypothetical protein